MKILDGPPVGDAVSLPVRYDGLAMALHWLTAALVVALFALAETWGFVPRGMPLRHGMQSLHISLGVTLAAVFLIRVLWRNTGARRVPPTVSGTQHLVALVVHYGLYGLLAVQIALGFLFRWAQGPAGFFGLFAISPPFVIGKGLHHWVAALHGDVAWVIMILAGGHSLMALIHHYLLRDGVLRRMLPPPAAR